MSSNMFTYYCRHSTELLCATEGTKPKSTFPRNAAPPRRGKRLKRIVKEKRKGKNERRQTWPPGKGSEVRLARHF